MGKEFETSMAIYCPSCSKKLVLTVLAPRAGRTHAIYKQPGADPENDGFFLTMRAWLKTKQRVTSDEVLRECLEIRDRSKWSVPIRRRVCSVLRFLGYSETYAADQDTGQRYRAWIKTGDPVYPIDPWEATISLYCKGKSAFSLDDVLREALDIQDRASWTSAVRRRIELVLRTLGYVDTQSEQDGLPVRIWAIGPPNAPAAPPEAEAAPSA